MIGCLKKKFREAKLSSSCEHQVAIVLREQALNYHLDPLLSTMCRAEIDSICKPTDQSDTASDGEVWCFLFILFFIWNQSKLCNF